MKDLAGKTAFVTGAASGVGLGIAEALAREQVSLVLADVDAAGLARAGETLARIGVRVTTLPVDVSDAAAMEEAARRVAALGALHLLFNNAGVAVPTAPISSLSLDDWHWLMGVNVFGVIHGLRFLLPLIRAHGQGGHVVNTASIGGLQVRPGRGTGGYAATKFAVVAISESLQNELAGSGIGVSVLCPAAVDTAIYESSSRRPARFGGPRPLPPGSPGKAELLAGGLPPLAVGRRVVEAIKADEFWVFTHEAPRAWLEERHRRLLDGFDRAERYNQQHGIRT